MSSPNTCRSSSKGDREVITSGSDKGTSFPHMAFQHSGSEEKERKVEGMCRLHQLESGLSKRSFSFAED